MSEQTTTAARPPYLFYALTALLIFSFLHRLLFDAHEYPMRTEQVMTMAIDAGCIAGLIGVRKSGPQALFWAALVCGIGLFLIRLHGDASWWTGHWGYSLTPRR